MFRKAPFLNSFWMILMHYWQAYGRPNPRSLRCPLPFSLYSSSHVANFRNRKNFFLTMPFIRISLTGDLLSSDVSSDTLSPLTSKKTLLLRIKHVFILVQLKHTLFHWNGVALFANKSYWNRWPLTVQWGGGRYLHYIQKANTPRFSKIFHYIRSHLVSLH